MSLELQPARGTAVDDEVVVRARTQAEALGTLFDDYYPRILRYCLRRLFVRAVAEDVTSEVFLQVARHIRGFPGTTQEDFRRWLYRIATNEVQAHLRKRRRRDVLLTAAVQSGQVRTGDSSSHVCAEVETADWPRAYQALLKLKPREQAIITLRYYEELSHDEIATILKERPATIRTALSRALDKLRRLLGVHDD